MKYIILTLILLFGLTGCSNSNHEENTENYNAEKVSSKNSTSEAYQEQELAAFSTTIYTKTEERQNNVKLACQELSGTIVEARKDFFFL